MSETIRVTIFHAPGFARGPHTESFDIEVGVVTVTSRALTLCGGVAPLRARVPSHALFAVQVGSVRYEECTIDRDKGREIQVGFISHEKATTSAQRHGESRPPVSASGAL